MRWNLDDIYTSFDSPEFIRDVETIERLAAEINSWSRSGMQGDPVDVLSTGIRMIEQFYNVFTRAITFSMLIAAVETENTKAQACTENLMVRRAALVESIVLFRKYLQGLGDSLAEISKSPKLQEFAFFLKENQDNAKYMLSDEVEKAISLMEITGSQAWASLQSTLTSTVPVEFAHNGEARQLTLPMVRNLAYDADPEVRRAAYEAELACYPLIDRGAAAALNGIKGEVLTKCKMRGFASPLEQTLFNSRMDKPTLDAMLGAMEEKLPVFRKYLKAKAKLLGKDALPFYDLFAPVGKVAKRYTLEEARQFLVDSFRPFSPEMADYISLCFEAQWLDTEPRGGKQGGAFCASIHPIGQPRILSNFDGSYNAVLTLAHELGHAWHGFCLNGESILNADYPMQLAETASTFNEIFINSNAIDNATSDDERMGLLDAELVEATQVVVDILSRYYFETEVFKRREVGIPGTAELKEMMLDAQKKAYGDGLDHALLHPYMWVCKGHYYSQPDFYNFPYAFGLLFGMGIYGLYKEKGQPFLAEYRRLLTASGSLDIASVCASVGIDVRDRAFWLKSLAVVEESVERFAALAAGA